MDARSIASLTISFGLVAIPVKLYSATLSTGRISFNMLHAKDGSRLRQQYLCEKEGKPVERKDIVKGYEFAKGQYVMFTPEELKALEEAGSHAVDVTEFVPLDSVDPIYFDRAYYLAPDKGGAKPYTLFAKALRATGQCAIGRWASHGREHIVLLRPLEQGLVMQQLHFAAEVRSMGDLEIAEAAVSDAELKLAQQLIAQQTSKSFDPSNFVDEVKQRIEAAIERKVEGKSVFTSEEPVTKSADNVIDLMDALRASLAGRGKAAPLKADRRLKAEGLLKTEGKATRRAPARRTSRR
jgi:DNA end-binding protein Ku